MTAQADARGLVARLLTQSKHLPAAGRSPDPERYLNPDGPEAAGLLQCLAAENAELLARIAVLEEALSNTLHVVDGLYRNYGIELDPIETVMVQEARSALAGGEKG